MATETVEITALRAGDVVDWGGGITSEVLSRVEQVDARAQLVHRWRGPEYVDEDTQFFPAEITLDRVIPGG